MKKTTIFAIGLTAVLMLSACKSDSDGADNGTSKNEGANIEQQSDMDMSHNNIQDSGQHEAGEQTGTAGQETDNLQGTAIAANKITNTKNTATNKTNNKNTTAGKDNSTAKKGGTKYTLKELRSMVDNFVHKINNLSADKSVKKSKSKYLALKKKEEQIDNCLDIYEDELENKYRKKSITRSVYKKREDKLDILENKLDKAEHRLEVLFGIDD